MHGPPGVGKRTVAEALPRAIGRQVLALDAATLAGIADDATAELVHAAEREARLAGDLLLIEAADLVLSSERRLARGGSLPCARRLGGAPHDGRARRGVSPALRPPLRESRAQDRRASGVDDLVLTEDRVQWLRELCDHARHRATVFDRWGFDRTLPSAR